MNALATWWSDHDISQEALAEKLGITQGQVSRLLSGDRKPGRRVALAIEAVTGGAVPAASWDPPAPVRRSGRRSPQDPPKTAA